MNSLRFWAVVALLLIAGAILLRRGDTDRVPPSEPLALLPTNIANMSSTDIPIEDRILEIMGKGIYLDRLYTPQASLDNTTSAPPPQDFVPHPVSLFIGYFPTQRTGQSIHSPQNCLPGAGWTFESSGTTFIPTPGGVPHRVGEYVISDGTNHAEVLYWYQSHGRTIANDYKAKLYMVADSIRYNRSDAALVRIITAVDPHETRTQAHLRAVAFATQLDPLLPNFIPN